MIEFKFEYEPILLGQFNKIVDRIELHLLESTDRGREGEREKKWKENDLFFN